MEGYMAKNKPISNDKNAFASSMAHILGKETATSRVILARSNAEKRIAEERLEQRAKRMLKAEKAKETDKDRRFPDVSTLDHERRLKRIATRGVVQLFNAIRLEQVQEPSQVGKVAPARRVRNKKKEKTAKVSKARFLDLLQGDAR